MRVIITALTVAFALAGATRAGAEPITYTESITTDGVFAGTPFTDELVTLTFTADTDNVTFFQGTGFTRYTNVPSAGTVTVAGAGTATFSDALSLSVVAQPTFSDFSVTDTALAADILDTFAVTSGFAVYDMQSSLSAVSGGAAYPVGTSFATDLGSFEFTKSGGGVSVVSAEAVPEPSSLLLIALGLSGLAAIRRMYTVSAQA